MSKYSASPRVRKKSFSPHLIGTSRVDDTACSPNHLAVIYEGCRGLTSAVLHCLSGTLGSPFIVTEGSLAHTTSEIFSWSKTWQRRVFKPGVGRSSGPLSKRR
jgi:hypothetical protein